MIDEAYRAALLQVAYLAACAVNETDPDPERVRQMDLTALYQAADLHMLTGITAMALERAGVKDPAFTQAKGKAIRRTAAFDVERAAVLKALEEAGIWYAPVKGCVLQTLYPRVGMRQMSDNDILYDETRTADVRAIMERLGFTAEEAVGRGINDHYTKPPVCSFEMHRRLFSDAYSRKADYYRDIRRRLLPSEGTRYGYHLSDEDFYVYLLAHEHKHYIGGGTGLRSVLDIYVYLKRKGSALDRTYLAGELERLALTDFEAQNRSLALHLFDGGELTAQDREMLEVLLSSGAYGTVRNRVRNRVRSYGGGAVGTLRYLARRLFLPLDTVRSAYPLFLRCPVLLPFLPLYRLARALASGKARAEWKALAPGREK